MFLVMYFWFGLVNFNGYDGEILFILLYICNLRLKNILENDLLLLCIMCKDSVFVVYLVKFGYLFE